MIRVKNKMATKKTLTACDIHMNVKFTVPAFGGRITVIAELQLLLQNLLLAKDLEHKSYEVKRSTLLTELMAPIY